MKQFLTSLYGRISVAYLLLLLVFSTLSVLATLRSAGQFTEESDQELNRDLASTLSERVEPLLVDSINHDALKSAFTDFMRVNPRVDIYLLDEDGRILSSSVDLPTLERDEVSMSPVRAYVGATAPLPILGADPRNVARKKIFSAAPIALPEGQSGYLYVVLLSKMYDSVASLVRDRYILQTAALNVALAFLFTAVAGILVFGFVTRRFRAVTRVVTDFEHGRLDERIDAPSQDEIGHLGRAVNSMADRIQAQMETLRQRDDTRREFIANISHDLRSPLTSIRGYVETVIMKNEALTDRERLEYLEIILEETTLLGNLISQLLELSKLDARQTRVAPEPFSPRELVQDVILTFKPQAEHLDLHLVNSLPNDLPMVCADIGMIERVLTNLVENAMRYTPSGGTIEIDGAVVDGNVRLSVSDTGCGIPADEIPRLTERFYKGKHAAARLAGGTGLGLAIAERILHLHGSDLGIRSSVGEGTTMHFRLKVEDRAPTPQA